MIRRVWSDLPGFRSTEFDSGMNVVLAQQSKESSETDSTNGLGKTTLLRIVHFCFGSDLNRDRVLSHPELRGCTFGVDFDFEARRYSVSRRIIGDSNEVLVSPEFIEGVDVDFVEQGSEFVSIMLPEWKRVLDEKFVFRGQPSRSGPTFRELLRYFVRIGKEAYNNPRETFSKQPAVQTREALAFMFGLNWEVQATLHEADLRRRDNNKVIKAIGAVEASGLSVAEMEAQTVVLQGLIAEKQAEVSSFNLRDDYRELEQELSAVDTELHSLINENHADGRLLAYYEASASEEALTEMENPVAILSEAGAIFRDEALRSIDEVAAFQQHLSRNRRDFLNNEIVRLKRVRRSRAVDIRKLVRDKGDVLDLLGKSGALEDLVRIQQSLTQYVSELEGIKSRIEERRRFEDRKDDIAGEIVGLRKTLKADLDDRRQRINEATALFAEYTKFLYGRPARLSVDVKRAGYDFKIAIEGESSDGVDQMTVFCFDLVVATLRSRRNEAFRVLFHDSTLFADVDPRQHGLALQLAAKVSAAEGFQYICCLNAGTLANAQLGDLNIESLVRQRLFDGGTEGRLLGVRLSPQESS